MGEGWRRVQGVGGVFGDEGAGRGRGVRGAKKTEIEISCLLGGIVSTPKFIRLKQKHTHQKKRKKKGRGWLGSGGVGVGGPRRTHSEQRKKKAGGY